MHHVVSLIFIIFGAIAVYACISLVSANSEKRRWPTTKGKMLERGVRPAKIRTRTQYEPQVKYSYKVEGKEYIGTQAYAVDGEAVGPGPEPMQKIVNALPDEVDVHYNPKNPAEAFLIPNAVWVAYLGMSIGFIVLIIGVGRLLIKLRG